MADRPNPIQFLREVRAEAAKIVWPSRRETGISTVMVVLMAAFASIFFLLADQVMARVVGCAVSGTAGNYLLCLWNGPVVPGQ